MMYNGESLCMGRCHTSERIVSNFANSSEANVYTVQVKQLPNAPIHLRFDSITQTKAGIERADVTIVPGDYVQLIPAWICVRSGLQVFIGQLSIGCLSGIATSFDDIKVEHSEKEVSPTGQVVTLHGLKGDKQFIMPDMPDETDELIDAVMDVIRGGDAVISTCGQ
mmetsp:Transcript_27623/g.50218  ORF Transcript_27623/g.50218 Transcript_27623/m.50218 type:complete len:166 (-) Transcript_27623:72-569(-)